LLSAVAKYRRKVIDAYNDEEVQITKEEAKIISRLLKGKTPHATVDPYPVSVTAKSIAFI
jgi:ribosome biogenesis protein ERB1